MATKWYATLTLIIGVTAPGCGMHVTSDKVKVEHRHTVTVDFEGLINYCEMACDGSTVCFEDCARRFIDLLNDPQICGALNTCASS